MENKRFYLGYLGFFGFFGFMNPAYFLFFLFFLFFLATPKSADEGGSAQGNLIQKQAQEKAEHKQKIKDFMQNKDEVTNKEVAEMLGVSDATVVRYLDELEKSGFLKQVGKTGQSVFYSKN